MKKITSAVAVLALTLALAVPAFGQSSVEGYNDEGGQVASQVQGGGNTPPGADDGSSLPFTGLDLSLLAAAGAVLMAAGLGMRRLTRAPRAVA